MRLPDRELWPKIPVTILLCRQFCDNFLRGDILFRCFEIGNHRHHQPVQLGITRIVIAHRLSTVVNCDRILVLDEGRIAEMGTYQQLMEKNGLFAHMARRNIL